MFEYQHQTSTNQKGNQHMPPVAKNKPRIHGQYRDSNDVVVREGETRHITRELGVFKARPGRKGVFHVEVDTAPHGCVIAIEATNTPTLDRGNIWKKVGWSGTLAGPGPCEYRTDVPDRPSPYAPGYTHVRAVVAFITPVERFRTFNGEETARLAKLDPYTATITLEYSEVEGA